MNIAGWAWGSKVDEKSLLAAGSCNRTGPASGNVSPATRHPPLSPTPAINLLSGRLIWCESGRPDKSRHFEPLALISHTSSHKKSPVNTVTFTWKFEFLRLFSRQIEQISRNQKRLTKVPKEQSRQGELLEKKLPLQAHVHVRRHIPSV